MFCNGNLHWVALIKFWLVYISNGKQVGHTKHILCFVWPHNQCNMQQYEPAFANTMLNSISYKNLINFCKKHYIFPYFKCLTNIYPVNSLHDREPIIGLKDKSPLSNFSMMNIINDTQLWHTCCMNDSLASYCRNYATLDKHRADIYPDTYRKTLITNPHSYWTSPQLFPIIPPLKERIERVLGHLWYLLIK